MCFCIEGASEELNTERKALEMLHLLLYENTKKVSIEVQAAAYGNDHKGPSERSGGCSFPCAIRPIKQIITL